MKWLLATGNKGKIRELAVILEPYNHITLVGLNDLNITADAPESGETFLENAMQKAAYYQAKVGFPVLADDSGLAVDALNGAPGIHSARFGGFETHREKRAYLLELLGDLPFEHRTARFHCAAVYFDGETYISAEEVMEGYVGFEERGDKGFGYDPIFFLSENGPTSGELEMDEKNRISHRGKAFRELVRRVMGQSE